MHRRLNACVLKCEDNCMGCLTQRASNRIKRFVGVDVSKWHTSRPTHRQSFAR